MVIAPYVDEEDFGIEFCFFALIVNMFDWVERLDALYKAPDRPMATARNIGIDMENFLILFFRAMDCFESDMPLREEL